MKVLLTNAMADELLNNEEQIKKQVGAYRPHYDPATKSYLPVIKCWPLEDFNGKFNQERDVIPGMENEVDDICLAKIDGDKMEYKVRDTKFYKKWDEARLDEYTIIIYTPKFNEDTIVLTSPTLGELFMKLKEYNIVGDKEENERNNDRMSWGVVFNNIDKWFERYQGYCTYFFLNKDKVVAAGKFDNKKVW